jgi:hypothetical protein
MIGMTPTRLGRLIAAAVVATGLLAVTAGSAGASEVVYDNIPGTLPGNFASFGNEAYSVQEFGGVVKLEGAARKNPVVSVVMSSWACQEGHWYGSGASACKTPKPKHKAHVPMTFSIYEVGPGNTVGALLARATKNLKMPYRPSDDPVNCPAGERWFDVASSTCFHGMAFTVKAKLGQVKYLKAEPPHNEKELPDKVIVTVSYNTSHYGPAPIGQSAPCYTSSAGCYYDSLNVAITEPGEGTLSIGKDPTNQLELNSTYAAMYCGSSTPLGTLGPTAPIEGTCASESPYETEAGIQPAFAVSAK